MSSRCARRLPRLRRQASFLVACVACAALLVACAPADAPAASPASAGAPAGAASPVPSLPDPAHAPERGAAPTPGVGAAAGAGAEASAAAAPSSVAVAPDPDAEEVHYRWVHAMLFGNEAQALAFAAETDPERRAEHVRKQLAVTERWLEFTNRFGLFGPYLHRFEVLGVVPGADEQERIGLSTVIFARGSSCFLTRLVRFAGAWGVVEWAPGVKECDAYVDRQLPGPLPTDASLAAAEDTFAEWVAAMFGGDPARAETLLIDGDAEQRQSLVKDLAFLTDYVVKGNETSYGPFQRYELTPTFDESLRHRVGYARVVYEHGQACFRADLHYLNARWHVKKWDHVIAQACA
ncbi:MAG: hypothetical protein ACUVS4_09655 [Chloroflexaceae bacterium]